MLLGISGGRGGGGETENFPTKGRVNVKNFHTVGSIWWDQLPSCPPLATQWMEVPVESYQTLQMVHAAFLDSIQNSGKDNGR